MCRQTGAEHVGHVRNLVFLAYRARLRCRGAALHRVSPKHRLGVAENGATDGAPPPTIQSGLTSQAVVHVSGAACGQQAVGNLYRLAGSRSCHGDTLCHGDDGPIGLGSVAVPVPPVVEEPAPYLVVGQATLDEAEFSQPLHGLTDLRAGAESKERHNRGAVKGRAEVVQIPVSPEPIDYAG